MASAASPAVVPSGTNSQQKTRFQGSKTATGKTKGVSKVVKGGESTVVDPTLSSTGKKTAGSGQPHVTYNGKLVTPQPLLSRKPVNVRSVTTDAAAASEVTVEVEKKTQDMTKKMSVPSMQPHRLNAPHIGGHKGNKVEESTTVILSETNTSVVFSLRSSVVPSDIREIGILDESNARYIAVQEAHKNAADNYKNKPAQTVIPLLKNQSEMAVSNVLKESGTQVLQYDITDALDYGKHSESDVGVGTDTADTAQDAAGFTPAVRKLITDTLNAAVITPGCILDITDISRPIGPSEASKGDGKGRKLKDNTLTSTAASEGPVAEEKASSVSYIADSGADHDMDSILRAKETERILSSKTLLKRLQMVERAVQQNAYYRSQLDYQSLPDVPPIKLVREGSKGTADTEASFGFGARRGMRGMGASKETPAVAAPEVRREVEEDAPKSVKKLFSFFYSDLIDGRAVTGMVWNAANNDLLAVAYGKIDSYVDPAKPGEGVNEERLGGLVLFWSLRNPEYPEKILRTPFPVTSLDFSKLSPMILAVGMINGDINLYDIKRETDWEVPLESSSGLQGAHSDPIWDMKWIVKGAERVENLVSISIDGKVLEWNMKKGLALKSLMQLTRGGTSEGWISRQAPGLCFSFPSTNPNVYVVGTEGGSIHKCSTSYTEQYLDTFTGHDGPVYKLKFSPRWPSVFLSCSADWNMGLYHLQNKDPLLKIHASGEDFSINDICWCPGNSTVFAAVTSDARLQIWDFAVSCIEPVVSLDTNVDAVGAGTADATESAAPVEEKKPGAASLTTLMRPKEEVKEESKESIVGRLIKNLSKPSTKRELTCLLFGERSPTIVVGDSRGAVTVYRVFDPITITNEGPMQMQMKLKGVIAKGSDKLSKDDVV